MLYEIIMKWIQNQQRVVWDCNEMDTKTAKVLYEIIIRWMQSQQWCCITCNEMNPKTGKVFYEIIMKCKPETMLYEIMPTAKVLCGIIMKWMQIQQQCWNYHEMNAKTAKVFYEIIIQWMQIKISKVLIVWNYNEMNSKTGKVLYEIVTKWMQGHQRCCMKLFFQNS